MSLDRDQGLAALQAGDVTAAITSLERAVQDSPNDFQAQMYLGAAYGQVGRNDDAIRVSTRAVEIEPANAQARYNLAVALERGGWQAEAVTALQQALTLQPDYPKAQEALTRLQGSATPAAAPVYAPPTVAQHYAPPTYAPPGVNPLEAGQYAPHDTAPPAPGYAQPTYAPPGQLPGGYIPAPGMAAYPQTAYVADSFDLRQAFRDWKQAAFSPIAFFQEQVGREGFASPIALILAQLLTCFVAAAAGGIVWAWQAPIAYVGFLFVALIYAAFLFACMVAGYFLYAGILYLATRPFGAQGTYGSVFRTYVYSQSAYWMLICGAALIGTACLGPIVGEFMRQMGGGARTGGPSTVAMGAAMIGYVVLMIASVVGGIWSLVTLCIGLSKTQRISGGAAVGAVVLGFVVPFVFLFFFMLMLGGISSVGR